MNIKSIIIAFLLGVLPTFLNAQESIEETKKIADDLFDDEKYVEATQYYLRLLALEPRDHNFNYRYGACLLFNGGKTQDVFKYLNYAVTNPNVDKEANYFLGKAYHMNYQFNDAIKYYKVYQQKAGSKPNAKLDVARQIQMCENGKKLITTITEMLVLDKKEIEKEKFFRIYDLNDIGGNLLVTAEFQTKIDEKRGHVPLIHFPENPNTIYYSSYGEEGKTGKDIYVQRRLPSGEWGLPQKLNGGVNTKFDEDYPYMHPDGKYLYFSSKGHNSMGGYDVFRCMYDKETDLFGLAENMDFAVSSPSDDLFYVVDSLNANAFFGSNRESTEGKLHVYKVKVDRVPLNMTVIKGDFSSTINPQMKKVWIDVTDYSNGEFIGTFNSNEKGVYLITFPKGGKYEFSIKVGENPNIYKYLANIPFQKEFKPLKQKIIHEMMDDVENVKVIDLFDENIDNPQAVFAKVIKMKSTLEPNVSAEEIAAIEKAKRDKEVLEELGFGNLSLVEFGYLLDEEVEDAKRAEKGTAEIENKLYAQVLDYTEEIQHLDEVIERQLKKAEEAGSDRKRYRALKYAEKALNTQRDLKKMSADNLALADSLSQKQVSGSSEKTAEIENYVAGFKELLRDNKQDEAYAYLADSKEFLQKTIEEKSLDPLQDLVEKSLELDEEINRLQPIDDQYARDLKALDAKIEELERSKSGKKNKEIEKIEEEIMSKKNERALVQDEKDFYGLDLEKKKAERSAMRKKIDALEAVYTYTTDKQVSKSEANNSVKSTNATNTSTLLADVLGQLTQLIVENPEVKNIDYAGLEEDLGGVVSNARERFNRINEDPNLTPDQRAERLRALDQDMYVEVKRELLRAGEMLKENPGNEQLRQKYEALRMAKSLVASSLDIDEDAEEDNLPSNFLALNRNVPKGTSGGRSELGRNGSTNNNANRGQNKTLERNNINRQNASQNQNTNINRNNAQNEIASNQTNLNRNNSSQGAIDTREINRNQSNNSSQVNQTRDLARNNNERVDEEVNVRTLEKGRINEEVNLNQNQKTGVERNRITGSSELQRKLIKNVDANYDSKRASIESNTSMSNAEKLKALQDLDGDLLKSVQDQKSTVVAKINTNPSDAASKQELAALKELEEALQDDISSRNIDINQLNNNLAVAPLTAKEKEEFLNALDPNYVSSIDAIKGNNSLNNVQKANEIKKIEATLLTNIEKEISSVETSLKVNPVDNIARKRLSDLKSIQTDLQSDIAFQEATIKGGVVDDSFTGLDARSKQALTETINPFYNEKVAQIKNNNAFSEEQKAYQLQQLDVELLSGVESDIKKQIQKVNSNSNDQVSSQRLSQLNVLREELQGNIASRGIDVNAVAKNTNQSNQPNNVMVGTLDARQKSQLINDLQPNYDSELARISSNTSLTESEKLDQIQALDNRLLSTLNNKVSTLKTELNANPSDLKLQEELKNLEMIQSDVVASINQRSSTIASLSQPLTDQEKNVIIDGLSPKYNVNIKAIQSNNSLTPSEKEAQIKTENEALLTLLNKEIEAIQNNMVNNNDPQLLKELKDLKSIKDELSNNTLRQPLTDQEKNVIIDGLSPKYNVNIKAIQSNNSLTSSEKEAKIKTENEALLTLLNKEIEAIQNDLGNNNDPQLRKKLNDLKSLRDEVSNKLSLGSSRTIASSNSVDFDGDVKMLNDANKATLIESLAPSYDDKIKQLVDNNSLSNADRNLGIIEQDKLLVKAIERELAKSSISSSRKSELETLKAEVNSFITKRERGNELSNLVSLRNEIYTDYNSNVTNIESNKKLSESEKLNRLQAEDQKLLDAINNAIEKSSLDQSKLRDLKQLKQETEMHMTARTTLIASSHEPLDDKTKQNLISEVDNKYQKNRSKIESDRSISELEKLNQIQLLDEELLDKIDEELIEVESELAKNPNDSELKKKDENLKSLKFDLQVEINKSESVLAASHNTLTTEMKNDLIQSVNSSYTSKLDEINSNKYLLDSEKADQIHDLNGELITDLKSEISKLKSKSSKTSADERRLIGLEEVLKDKENDYALTTTTTASTIQNELTAKSQLISKIDPSYENQLEEINSDALMTQAEKLTKLQELDQNLLTKIEKELAKATSNAKKKKDDQDVQNRKSELEDLKQSAENVIGNRNIMIAQLEGADVSNEAKSAMIKEVRPSYNANVKKINSSNQSSVEKLEALYQEESLLVSDLTERVASLEASVKKSPKDDKLKEDLTTAKATLITSEEKVENLQHQVVVLKSSEIDQKALVSSLDPSYDQDIKQIMSSNADDKAQQLARREEALQVKLNAKIESNNNLLNSSEDLNVVAENNLLAQKVKESNKREENFKNGVLNAQEELAFDAPELKALRSELLSGKENVLTDVHSDIAALQAQQIVLNDYESKLIQKLKATEDQISKGVDSDELNNEKNALENELMNVQEKEKEVKGKIDVIIKDSPTAALTSPALKKLQSEEQALIAQLEDKNLSKKEVKALEKQLAKVVEQRKSEQNNLITKDLTAKQKVNSQKVKQLKSTANVSDLAKANAAKATAQNKRLSSEADVLLEQANKTKKVAAKNKLLIEAADKQAQADEIVKNALEENVTSVAIANKVNTLDSKEELLAKQSRLKNEIIQLDAQIEDLDVQISETKKRKQAPLKTEKTSLAKEKSIVEQQLSATNDLIASIKETPKVVDEKALEQEVSLLEEKEIIASKDYLEYTVDAKKAQRLENQIAENEKALAVKRQEAKAIIAQSLEPNSAVSEDDIAQSVDIVKTIEDEIATMTKELVERQERANDVLARNPSKASRMQNLLERGVEPGFNEDLAIFEQQRKPAEGIRIAEAPLNAYSDENPIPVGVKLPSGLVYRVQVGAFSKPIEQTMYNMFTPITGEKVSMGYTRYMAGYFNNFSSVEQALSQVKSIGYDDAFMVSYCDGERIPIAEAKRLEATGQCVSTSSQEFVIALKNMKEQVPQQVDDLSYNEAPGAAKAVPVESRKGLFYTVQVGVYNKPVTAKQLKNIDPLVTERLSNGQIRYSSGMFTSVDNAKPKKADARARGIKDAFITAYYNGERISLKQAKALLQEKGEGVLENVDDFVAAVEKAKQPVTDESIDYNKAPGAIPAKAAEAHQGLFFTVQIGVYSRPLTDKQLNYVTPLITKKLENGQIRYSSGMFDSIEKAEAKRLAVLKQGVKHAYVTAYYNGERIPLAEARALLLQHGESILEKE